MPYGTARFFNSITLGPKKIPAVFEFLPLASPA